MLELKLDVTTMFEWQKHSQLSTDVPPYQELLEFIDLRAQTSEASTSEPTRKASSAKNDSRPTTFKKTPNPSKPVTSHTAAADTATGNCVLCKTDKHLLYICTKFKALSHDKMVSTLKSNGLCLNCLQPGHFVKDCVSVHVVRDVKNLTIHCCTLKPRRKLLLLLKVLQPIQLPFLFPLTLPWESNQTSYS